MRNTRAIGAGGPLKKFLVFDVCNGASRRVVLGTSLESVKRKYGWRYLCQECPPAGEKNKRDSSLPAASPSFSPGPAVEPARATIRNDVVRKKVTHAKR